MFKHSMRLLSTVLVVFGARAACLAGAGDLDQSFGNGGLVTTDFAFFDDRVCHLRAESC